MPLTPDSAAGIGVIERYRPLLPVTDSTPAITLGEGGTPLIRMPALEGRVGAAEVWLKLEGCNPTGSFKDRGMVVAVAKALEAGAHTVVCASTGNTSASAAAYAARSGIDCVIIVAAAKVALGKLAQTRAYSARVVDIGADFDTGLRLARDLSMQPGVTLVNSINQNRLEGQENGCFRGRRPARFRARRAFHTGWQRRQHLRLLGGIPPVQGSGQSRRHARHARLSGRGRRAHRP